MMSKLAKILFGVMVLMTLFFPVEAEDKPLLLVTPTYPPYSYAINGVPAGLYVDIVREVFTRLHQSIVIEVVPLARATAMVEAGEADGFFGVVKTKDREKIAVFPQQRLLSADISFFVKANSSINFDGELSKLTKFRFGMIRGSKNGPAFDSAVADGLFQNVESVTDHAQSIQMLIKDRIDLAVGPRVVIWHVATEGGRRSEIRELLPSLHRESTYLAFSRKLNRPSLIEEFSNVMAQIERDGTLTRLAMDTGIPLFSSVH